METFKIHRWDTGDVIASVEAETLKEALEKLVANDTNLYRARLVGARLVGASLVGASLDGARLDGARLDGARLVGARLVGASLVGARLVGASLVGARLDRASLDGANLEFIKHDLWGILLHVPHEVDGLLAVLREGRVDGSAYEGRCACLVGTIANVRGCNYHDIPGVNPDSSRPAEVWFMSIAKGDTPETNQVSKITVGWVEEFQKLTQAVRA